MRYKRFPAKTLLFGEHILLRGASALSVPVPRFGGHWAWTQADKAAAMQGRLREFAQSEHLRRVQGIDINGFQLELARGIWLRTDMLSGYGLGSSGVVCAAVYDRYCREKATEIADIKADLAQMESFFHHKSSGIDPLTSYLGQPILVRRRTETEAVTCPNWSAAMRIFLLDSRQNRHTGPLVQRFAEMCQSPDFSTRLDYFLVDSHEPMVADFLAGRFDSFWENLAQVSDFQWRNMRYMIPETVQHRWRQGLEQGDFLMKICGAGGGGFMLLFTRNNAAAEFLARLHRLTELKILA